MNEPFDDSNSDLEAPPADSHETQTALIPNEFFGDKELKPGTECKVKIEKVLDGQCQVSYVPHKESEREIGEEEPAQGDEEMSGYMEM